MQNFLSDIAELCSEISRSKAALSVENLLEMAKFNLLDADRESDVQIRNISERERDIRIPLSI